MRRSFAGLVVCAIVVGTAVAGASPAVATGADPTLPGCTGGVAANPSVDQTASKGGAPTGYTFVPASPVPGGTPGNKQPKLYTDSTYTYDGSVYALISTPDGKVSEAYEDIKPAIPGAVYDLSVWAGTHETSQENLVGLRFLDVGGKVIGNFTKDVTHDVDTDKKLGRENLYGVVAPPGTATVRFFASTNYNWVKWDCVYLRVSAYTIQKEVQDTASGQWMDADGDPASPGSNDSKPAVIPPGNNANYRVTVKNTGSEPLSAIQVTDAWCSSGLDTAAFTLAAGASKQLTCVHNGITQADEGHINTATASGAKYWNGVLPNKSETARIVLAPPPPKDKLGDFVWADNNRDGVQDPGEPGVPGVLVTLKDDKGTAVAQKTTDKDGKYLFEALKDASYQACFDLKQLPAKYAGYLTTKVDAGGDDTKDSDADATGCTPVTALGPNKPTDLTLDAGIRPPNRLGDYAWIDDNKDGLQTAGEPPAPGVIVILKDDKATELNRTTTKADGKYLFDGLKDGGYQVCFDLSGLPDYQVTKPNTGDDGTDSDADPATRCTKPTTLNADSPEDLTLDIGLIKPVNRVGDLVWADMNGNGLQDADEPGVEGVPVTLKGTQAGTVKTGPDGKYLFDNLSDGNYQVCFDLKQLPVKYADYLPTSPNTGPDAADSDADPSGCTPTVPLGPGKRENLTLDAGIKAPPNRLGDFVWVDSNKNGLQDNGEAAVTGLPVTLKGGATKPTGKDGKYIFDDLPDGEYQVCFDRTKLPAVFADYVFTKPRTGDATKDSDADPETGCTLPTKLGVGHREDLTLDAGIAPPANRIGDFVWVDKNSNGLQDANEPGVPNVPVTLEGPSQASTKTGPDGKYLFDSLPDGDFKVCFGVKSLPDAVKDYALTKPNTGDDGKDSDADGSGCTPTVKLGTGNRENLTLDAGLVAPPNRIGDFVWVDKNSNGLQDSPQEQHGEPGVPNVPVKLKDTDLSTKTGPDGKYVFDNVPDGTYQVCFGLAAVPGEFAGYMPTKPNAGDDGLDSDADLATGCTPPAAVGVDKRENLTLDLGLVPPANRLGDYVWYDKNSNGLQDSYEPGIDDLTVVLQDDKGAELARTKTDAKGGYLFDRLADGTYRVCFDIKHVPAEYANAKLTRVNAGDDAKDSDADPGTGCTAPTTLGPNRRVDLTLDAGFLPVPKRALSSTGFWVIGPIMVGSVLLIAGAVLLFVASRRRRRTR